MILRQFSFSESLLFSGREVAHVIGDLILIFKTIRYNKNHIIADVKLIHSLLIIVTTIVDDAHQSAYI
ncbi:hypothetical protein GHV41_02745 [Serratia proteamaculans]|uniref:Uncharacterized protein n=1 Tax=Serratia proteamaculans TaxID=28151 RepID=A0A5Q2V6X2_SERPR|nr:hypothetical protein GHV41_02745 [Serratia proteamaculans]